MLCCLTSERVARGRIRHRPNEEAVTCVTNFLNSGADCCAKRRSVLAGLRLSGDTNSLIARFSGLFVWPASIEECHNGNFRSHYALCQTDGC